MLRGHNKFIATFDPSLSASFKIPVGKFKALRLVTSTAECTTGDLLSSSYQLFLNGKTIHDLAVLDLQDINNAFKGKPSYAVSIGTGVGGDDVVSFNYDIPFEFEDPNALDVGENDTVYLRWINGNCERGSVRLYGIEAPFQHENYIPLIHTIDATGDGRVRANIPGSNVKYLLVCMRDITDHLEVYADGNQICSAIPAQDEYDFSEKDYNIETGDLAHAIIDVSPNSSTNIAETMNDDVYAICLHAAPGTSKIIAVNYDYDIDRMHRSASRQAVLNVAKESEVISKEPERAQIINPGVYNDQGRKIGGGSRTINTSRSPLPGENQSAYMERQKALGYI